MDAARDAGCPSNRCYGKHLVAKFPVSVIVFGRGTGVRRGRHGQIRTGQLPPCCGDCLCQAQLSLAFPAGFWHGKVSEDPRGGARGARWACTGPGEQVALHYAVRIGELPINAPTEVRLGESTLGHSFRTAGHPGKGGGTGTLVGLQPSPAGPVALAGAACSCSTCLQPHQSRAWESRLPPPAAAIGLHGTESPSNEQRNKSYKAGRDLLDFNILEIMRTFLLACNTTGPNRITTRIYPCAFPRRGVGFSRGEETARETAGLCGEQDGGATLHLQTSRGGSRASGCPNSSGSVPLPTHHPARAGTDPRPQPGLAAESRKGGSAAAAAWTSNASTLHRPEDALGWGHSLGWGESHELPRRSLLVLTHRSQNRRTGTATRK